MLELVSLSDDGGQAPAAQLLARHAAAARHRPRAARRPVGADPRRAGQRSRPGRHPLDARPAQGVRRPRRHRAAVQPPAQRGRADRRRDDADRPRQDRRPGRQGVAAGGSGTTSSTLVTSLDNELLATVLSRAGIAVAAAGHGPARRGDARSRSAGPPPSRRSSSPTCAPAEGGLEDLFLAAHLRHPARRPRRLPEGAPRHEHHRTRPGTARPRHRATPPVPMSRLRQGRAPQGPRHPRRPAGSRSRSWRWSLVVQVIFAFAAPDDAQGLRRLPRHRRRRARLLPADPRHHAGHQRVEPAHRPGDLHPRATPVAGRRRQGPRRLRPGGRRDGARRADRACSARSSASLDRRPRPTGRVDGNLLFNGFVLANVIGVLHRLRLRDAAAEHRRRRSSATSSTA